MKKIIITGATGLIGRGFCARLIEKGNEITMFSRNPAKATPDRMDAGAKWS
jgi:uncharacterized protein YbjT (DUF2867 family)